MKIVFLLFEATFEKSRSAVAAESRVTLLGEIPGFVAQQLESFFGIFMFQSNRSKLVHLKQLE